MFHGVDPVLSELASTGVIIPPGRFGVKERFNRRLKSRAPAVTITPPRGSTDNAAPGPDNGTMVTASEISAFASLGAVNVVFDASFLLISIVVASIAVPLIGAVFLGVWCRMLDVPPGTFRRRFAAYGASYAIALALAMLMMFLVRNSSRVPGWFLASLFGQAMAVHAVVVPKIMKTLWGPAIKAQAMTLVLYAAVLVIGLAPVIIHVRKAVDRGEWTADLEQLYSTVTSGKGMDAEKLPITLTAAAKESGRKIQLLPGHDLRNVVYLGDYVNRNYRSTHSAPFVSSMPRIRMKTPRTAPLLWRNPKSTRAHKIPVCSYDGAVTYLAKRELEYLLERTLLELDKMATELPTTAPIDERQED